MPDKELHAGFSLVHLLVIISYLARMPDTEDSYFLQFPYTFLCILLQIIVLRSHRHCLRRSKAPHFAQVGTSLEDIKKRGNWKSAFDQPQVAPALIHQAPVPLTPFFFSDYSIPFFSCILFSLCDGSCSHVMSSSYLDRQVNNTGLQSSIQKPDVVTKQATLQVFHVEDREFKSWPSQTKLINLILVPT